MDFIMLGSVHNPQERVKHQFEDGPGWTLESTMVRILRYPLTQARRGSAIRVTMATGRDVRADPQARLGYPSLRDNARVGL
jgi:hypothetical protein